MLYTLCTIVIDIGYSSWEATPLIRPDFSFLNGGFLIGGPSVNENIGILCSFKNTHCTKRNHGFVGFINI